LYSNILVAINATFHSETVLKEARELALLTHSNVHLVHVSAQEWVEGQELTLEDPQSVEAFLDQALASFTSSGIHASRKVIPADSRNIGEAILKEADTMSAPLVIIGTHHRQAWLPLLGERISDHVAHRSPHPVLLVP
jgi:nucleotide-binding universal stress UspA family protein